MALTNWVKKNKRFFLSFIGLVAFVLYIMIFNIDLLQLIAIIGRLNLLFFSLALLIGIVEILFFALSWKVLLSFLNIEVSLRRALLYVLYGFYVDIIVPLEAVTGDIARVYLVSREKNGFEKIIASVLVQRLLGMVLNIAALMLGVLLVVIGAQIDRVIVYYLIFVAGIISIILCFVIILIARKSLSIKIINNSLSFVDKVSKNRWDVSKWKGQIVESIDKLRSAMIRFRDRPYALTVSMIYLIFNWICSFSIPYIIFLSLSYPVPLSTIIITASIIAAVKSIPAGVPFEIGIPEIAMTTLFIALGVPVDVSTVATILTRVITLWFRFGLGFAAQQWIELKLNKALKNAHLRSEQ